jgi:hypothetical protein
VTSPLAFVFTKSVMDDNILTLDHGCMFAVSARLLVPIPVSMPRYSTSTDRVASGVPARSQRHQPLDRRSTEGEFMALVCAAN